MGLIHVEGADPHCSTCHGSGVKPLFGYGTPCHCTEGIDDPLEHAREEGRKAAHQAMDKAFAALTAKTKANLKAIDDMTVISPEREL